MNIARFADSYFQAAAKRMARDHFPGKIVLVSSFLGFMSIVGYSSYAPAKHALRGNTLPLVSLPFANL